MDIPQRQKDILESEGMLNDATGLVAVQFAVAAVATGAFSLIDASIEFVFAFFGGILIGAALGFFANYLLRKVREIGLENTTFHVLFEVFVPFIVYLACNAIGVSGVIAVVAAGIAFSVRIRTSAPSTARTNIVSSSVWRVLSFALNGVVFVLLGTQLPKVMRTSWEDVTIANEMLVVYVLLLTLLVYAVRFVWVLGVEYVHWRYGDREKGFGGSGEMRSVLITTLSGAKGTITLAAVLTLPSIIDPSTFTYTTFPQKDLLIFLSCGVILVTMLVATFVVPLLAPARSTEGEAEELKLRETECRVEILRRVAEELTARQTADNRRATRAVVHSYNERIEKVKKAGGIEEDFEADQLRIRAIGWEREYVTALVDGGGADPLVAYDIMKSLDRSERILKHGSGQWSVRGLYRRFRTLFRKGSRALIAELSNANLAPERAEARQRLQIDANEYVVEKLRRIVIDHNSSVPTEIASALLMEYQRSIALLRSARISVSAITATADKEIEVRRTALQLELEQIQSAYEDNLLSRKTAQRLRENVHLMQLDLEDNV